VRSGVAVVRGWHVAEVVGDLRPMHSASLVKLVIGHLALEVIDDLDEAFYGPISFRHLLSHTSGLPNNRPPGGELVPRRPAQRRSSHPNRLPSRYIVPTAAPGLAPSRPQITIGGRPGGRGARMEVSIGAGPRVPPRNGSGCRSSATTCRAV
jgi:hypothetical protein